MYSYRHAFHAGSFADVFKHAVLALLLDKLRQKEKPFFYCDTHAGLGVYDLHQEPSQKTLEYQQGIARIWDEQPWPEPLIPYRKILDALNSHGLQFYPGSPEIARQLLRPHDRAVLIEINERDCLALQQQYRRDSRIQVVHGSGYKAYTALLPPPERRGVVFCDPAYETSEEFDTVASFLSTAYQRWPTGIYALWYPVLERAWVNRLKQQLCSTGIRRIWNAELCIAADNDPLRLKGSGLVIINLPWPLDTGIDVLLHWLSPLLAPDYPNGFSSGWWVPE